MYLNPLKFPSNPTWLEINFLAISKFAKNFQFFHMKTLSASSSLSILNSFETKIEKKFSHPISPNVIYGRLRTLIQASHMRSFFSELFVPI